MKHLIAAAQAKRRQPNTQDSTIEDRARAFLSATNSQGRSPSPVAAQYTLSSKTNLAQIDAQCQATADEVEDRQLSSGYRGSGGSISDGIESTIARDAFEGMIETLSRTRESIGRATRLALDCAKYGIAVEVSYAVGLVCYPFLTVYVSLIIFFYRRKDWACVMEMK